MSDLSPISSRLHAIEARVAQLEQASRAGGGNARLGFGLALQNAAIDAAVPASSTTTTDPAAPATAGPTVLSSPAVTLGATPASAPAGPAASTAAVGSTSPASAASGSTAVTSATAARPDSGSDSGSVSGSGTTATVDPVDQRPDLTPATVRSGSYGQLEPPAELLAYGNGRIPASALTPIGDTGHLLYGPAAAALNALITDATAAGVTVGVTDSYRSYDAQVDLARRKGLYSRGGLAASPGTSNHGWGLATDLRLDGPALAWMRDNAWRYGYVEDVPREPWHWTYRPDPN